MSKPNQPISVLQVTALTPWTRLRLRRSSPLPHNTRPRLFRNRPISVPLPCLSDASDRPLEVDNPAAAASLDSRTISSVKQSQKKRSLSSFTVGEVVEGVVKNVVPFGCFVDVGGVEDILVHISDFANAFCNDPSKFVQKGEEVKLEVIQVEANKMKGSFKGLMGFEETVKESSSSSSSSSSSAAPRRRTPEKDYSITEVFEGVVERVTVSGAIVRFDNEESTGFLPVEELPDAKTRQASEIKTSDLIQVGQKLEVRVMEYQSRNSILLTTKSVTEVEEDKAMESEGLFISDIKPNDYAIFKTAFKKAGLISNMFTEEVKEATGIDDVELQTVMESEAPVESVEIPEVQSSDVNEASVLKDQTEASAGTKSSAEKPPAITEEEDPILEIQEQETEAQSEAEAKTEEVTVMPPVIAKEEPVIEIQEQVTEVQQEAITETEEITEIPAPEAEETPVANMEEPVAELEEQVTEAQEEAVAVTEETTEAAAPTAEETPVVEIEEPVIEIQERVTEVQQEAITETEEITEIPALDAEEKPVAKMEEPVAEPQEQVTETQEETVAVTEETTEVTPSITKEEEKTPVVEIEEPIAEIQEQVTEVQQEAITETEEITEIPAPEAEEKPVAKMEEPVAEPQEQVAETQEETVAVTEETTEVTPSITKEEEKTPVVEIEEPIAEIQEQVTEVQQEAITETEEITEIPAPEAEEKPVANMEEPVAEPQEQVTEVQEEAVAMAEEKTEVPPAITKEEEEEETPFLENEEPVSEIPEQVTEATEETVAMTEKTTEAAADKAEEIPVVEIEEPVIEIQEQVTESQNETVAAETTEVLSAITKKEETPVVKAEEPVAEIQDQLTETQEETAAVTEETTETPAPKVEETPVAKVEEPIAEIQEQVTDGQEKIVTEMEPPTSAPKAEETPVVEIEEPVVEIQEQVTESENEAVAAEITEVPPAITKEEETPVVEIEEPVAELQEQVTEAQQEAITETEETTEIPAPEAEETPVAELEEQVTEAQEEAVAVTEEKKEVPPAITKEEEKTPVVEIEEPVAEIPEQVTEDQQESVSKIEEATEEQTEEAENETEVEPEAPSLPSEQQSVAAPLKQESKSIVISAKLVKELREITGAGMLDCKKALVESKGDIESAMNYLKKKGIASAAKRAGRIATEGLISSYVHHGDKLGILLEVNSETDFVSRSDQFKDFVNDVAMTIASCPDAICISPEDFPLELLEKEREIEMSKEELLSKPEGIREKIVSGKLEKLKKTGAVLKQPFIRNQEIKVEDALNELAVTLGEKISIRRFERYVLGEGLEKKSTDFASEVTDQIEAKKAQAIVSQNQTAQAETAQNEIAQVTLTENETAQNEDAQNAQPELAPEAPVYKVSAVQVKELRLMTGGGMLDCKKALLACQGDMDAASEFLRKKGLAGAAKKADRLASEGAIGCYVHTGSKLGVMVEVNCETDFVSRSELFKELVQDIKLMITACPEVQYITNDEIPQSVKDKELQLEMQKEDLLTKPENIRQKIAEGRVGKTLQVMCLFDQPTLKDSSKTVREMVQEAIAALGENIRVRRFVRFNLGEGIEKKEANFAEEVAQQVEKTQA
eukprot:g4115.t1